MKCEACEKDVECRRFRGSVLCFDCYVDTDIDFECMFEVWEKLTKVEENE